MRDPEGDRARMHRRRDNLYFLLIFGSIVFITILLVMLAKGLQLLLTKGPPTLSRPTDDAWEYARAGRAAFAAMPAPQERWAATGQLREAKLKLSGNRDPTWASSRPGLRLSYRDEHHCPSVLCGCHPGGRVGGLSPVWNTQCEARPGKRMAKV
jgi:hypothetical protein